MVIRGIDDAVKERIRARAKRNRRSLEAELRSILEKVAREEQEAMTQPGGEKGFGTLMLELFGPEGLTLGERRRIELAEADIRSRSRMRIPDFE